MRTRLAMIFLSRPFRVMAITAAGLCLALGLAYAAFAQSGSPAANTTPARVQKASGIIRPADVRFAIIGYDCCVNGRGMFEHVHFKNFGTSAVNITGWRIYSPATGDSYIFPTASAPPYGSTLKEMTLNTNYDANADYVTIFNWKKPGKDEWPNAGGVAYLYDASNNLVATCNYTPTVNDGGNADCQ